MKILVTAAGGKQGKRLIPKLAAAGHHVRAVRLSAGRDDELLRLGAREVITGDLASLDLYTAALEGCDAVYHVGPTGMTDERESGFVMIEAAKRSGTRHIVFSSVYHTVIDILQHRYKRDIEEKLFDSGLNCTVLRPCDYMMADYHVGLPFELGMLPFVWATDTERLQSLIDVEDLTDVAAKVLIEGDKHFFADYELSGPDKLTCQAISVILSRVFGRDIPAVPMSVADYVYSNPENRKLSVDKKHLEEVMMSISEYYSRLRTH